MRFRTWLRTGTGLGVLGAVLAFGGGEAFAQSTGTQQIEEIIVTGTRIDLAGMMVAEREPKSRVAIDSEFLSHQAPGQTVLDSINLLPAVEKLLPEFKTVKHVVAMCDRAHLPADCKIPNLLVYEELIADKPGTYEWPEFDERTASSLCYTSGTTGNPKGVLYSHRSTMLHAYGSALPDTLGLSARSVVLPVVPKAVL